MFLSRAVARATAVFALAGLCVFTAHGASLNGEFYFVETDPEHGTELWKSNGTEAGTFAIDVYPGTNASGRPNNSTPASLAVLNNSLFFAATGEEGRELWRHDGTAPVMFANIAADVDQDEDTVADVRSSNPANLTVVGTNLFFTAHSGSTPGDAGTGTELYVTDGTAAPTAQDIKAGPEGSFPQRLFAASNGLYFVADDAATGYELWFATGDTATRVADIWTGDNNGSFPQPLAETGGRLFFTAYTPELGYELYNTTGSGATLVDDIRNGPESGLPAAMVEVPALNRMYFTADDGVAGRELMFIDPAVTGAQAAQVVDLRPADAEGNKGSNPSWLTLFGDRLYFVANDGNTGVELWRLASDGSPELFANINLDTNSDEDPENEVIASSSPAQLTVAGGKLYFTATDGSSGVELFVTDGSVDAEGKGIVTLVRDIAEGAGSASPTRLEAVGNELFFFANSSSTRTELWKTDGTGNGTVLVKAITRSTPSAGGGGGGGGGGGASGPALLLMLGLALLGRARRHLH